MEQSMEQSSSLEADTPSDAQEIPIIYGTRMSITVFIRAHHWNQISLRSILMLPFQLYLDLLGGVFLLGVPKQNFVKHFLFILSAIIFAHLVILVIPHSQYTRK
jgi:hypothetical protein